MKLDEVKMTTGNSKTMYDVIKDGKYLGEPFKDKKEAIAFAKKNNADKVDSVTINEKGKNSYAVWTKPKFRELNRSVKYEDSYYPAKFIEKVLLNNTTSEAVYNSLKKGTLKFTTDDFMGIKYYGYEWKDDMPVKEYGNLNHDLHYYFPNFPSELNVVSVKLKQDRQKAALRDLKRYENLSNN